MKNNVFRGCFESANNGKTNTVHNETGKICKKHNPYSEAVRFTRNETLMNYGNKHQNQNGDTGIPTNSSGTYCWR